MWNKTAHVILCQWTFKSSPFTTRQYISYNCSHLLKRHHWCCVYSFQFWSLYIFAAEMSHRNAENMQINMCSTRAAVTFGLNDWVQAVQIGFRYFPWKVNPLLLPSDVESGPSVSTQANLSWSPESTDEREFMIMFMLCVCVFQWPAVIRLCGDLLWGREARPIEGMNDALIIHHIISLFTVFFTLVLQSCI